MEVHGSPFSPGTPGWSHPAGIQKIMSDADTAFSSRLSQCKLEQNLFNHWLSDGKSHFTMYGEGALSSETL